MCAQCMAGAATVAAGASGLRAWLGVTLLTIGYMISRGIAKSGVIPTTPSAAIATPTTSSPLFLFTKRPGERTNVRFMPGCLVFSLLLSVGLTILLNVPALQARRRFVSAASPMAGLARELRDARSAFSTALPSSSA